VLKVAKAKGKNNLRAGRSAGKKPGRRGNPKIREVSVATRWKPGQSGNPSGSSKARIISQASREILEEIDPKTGLTYAKLVSGAQLNEALNGNTAAFNALADRTEGRPQQSLTLGGQVDIDMSHIDERIRTFAKRIRNRDAEQRRKA
jgi:hypothetical protein